MVPRDQSSLTLKKTPKFSRKAHDSHLLSVRPTSFFQVASLELTPDSLGKTHYSMDGVIVAECYFYTVFFCVMYRLFYITFKTRKQTGPIIIPLVEVKVIMWKAVMMTFILYIHVHKYSSICSHMMYKCLLLFQAG